MTINLKNEIFSQEKMKMENGVTVLEGAYFALQELTNMVGFTDHMAHKNLGVMLNGLKKKRETFYKQHDEIIKKHAVINEEGNIETVPSANAALSYPKYKDAEEEKLAKEEIETLVQKMFVLENCYPISYTHFKGIYEKIKPKIYSDLEVLFAEYQHEHYGIEAGPVEEKKATDKLKAVK